MDIHEVSFELFTIAHNFYEINTTVEKVSLRIEYWSTPLSLNNSLYKCLLTLCCSNHPASPTHNICFTAKSIAKPSRSSRDEGVYASLLRISNLQRSGRD